MSIESLSLANRKRLLTACAVAIVIAGPLAANGATDGQAGGDSGPAASTDNASSGSLSEIVVTARKRTERLIDVPVAVTEMSAATLSSVPSTSLTQIGNLVPGVSLERMGGGSTGAAFEIRGVGQLAQDFNSEQPVALNIDGVQVTKGPAGQIVFFDLQDVQVLKGPQALFFGKNSPAGVVSLNSVSPGQTEEGYVRVGYEFSASTPSVEGAISIPLSDTLSMRIAAHYDNDNSGYNHNVAGPLANPFDPSESLPGAAYSEGPLNRNGAARLTLAWRPDGRFDATFKLLGSYHHDNGGATEEVSSCGTNAHPTTINLLNPAQAYQDPYGGCSVNHILSNGIGPAPIVNAFLGGPSNGKPFTETSVVLSSLSLNYKFDAPLTLTSVTGVYHSKRNDFDNYDLTVYAQALEAEYDKDTQVSEELRLTSDYSGPVNFTTGFYFENDDHDVGDTDRVFNLPLYFGPGPYAGISNDLIMQAKDKAQSYSVFGELRWKILDNLEFAGGARYSHDHKSGEISNLFNYFDLIAPTANPFSPAGVVYDPSVTASNVSPQATLTWHPERDLTVYGAFKTGYLAPGIGNPANVTNLSANPNANAEFIYQAEKVNGFELGTKGIFLDGRLTGALTLYRYTYKDLQVATFHPETLSFLPGNAGKARNEGVEFETTFNVTQDFQLRASMIYSDLKFIEYTGAQCYPGESVTLCPDGTQDLSGSRYGDGPFTGKVGFRYSHPVAAGLSAALDADVSHTSAAPAYERDPWAVSPAYTIVNAALRLYQPAGPWEFDVLGLNLNNGIYYKNFIFKPLGASDDIGAQSVGAPRMVEVRAQYKF
jgi:iron complex outermembrane recepter protein